MQKAALDAKLLPYGGDVQAAMKAGDRSAIKVIFEARKKAEAGQPSSRKSKSKKGNNSGKAPPKITVRDNVHNSSSTSSKVKAPAAPPSASQQLQDSADQLAEMKLRVEKFCGCGGSSAVGGNVPTVLVKESTILEELITRQMLALDLVDIRSGTPPPDADTVSSNRAMRKAQLVALESMSEEVTTKKKQQQQKEEAEE